MGPSTLMSRPWPKPVTALGGLLLIAAVVVACRQPEAPASTAASPRTVTFNGDVAPILFDNCATCHRPIEPEPRLPARAASTLSDDPLCVAGAPFSVLDYDAVRANADAIAWATGSRAMPPWMPEPGHGRFLNERRLRDEQIATIQEWVRQGAPRGDSSDAPQPPEFAGGWQLGTPDLVLQLAEPFTVPAGDDVFRNFVIPVPRAPARYVRAIEFRADNPRALHHASVAVDPARVSRRLDRADPAPGFATMPEDEVQNVYGWSPGKVPVLEPADTAWTLDEGSDLVLQLHMVGRSEPETVQPSIGLFFSDRAPTRVPVVVKLESKAIDIPAGQPDYVVEDRYVLPADVEVVSVYPHAHYLATELHGTATLPDGTTTSLIWIRRWDIRWQDQYRYESPVFLPRGTVLAMRFVYDNSEANPSNPHRPPRRVQWGPQSTDEMGALWVEVIPRRTEDIDVLTRDYFRRALLADMAAAELRVQSEPANAAAHNLLATKYLQAGRVQDARTHLQEALRMEPDNAEARSNLGTVLQVQGRLDEALQHLNVAVRLAPDDDRVRFNLANAMSAAGRTEGAIGELRRSIAINPDNADAHFNLAMLLGPQNRLDDAIAHLRRVVDINPRHADAYRNLAVALGLQGRVDEAIIEARRSLNIQPDSVEAQRHLNQLLQAQRSQRAR
jgi:Flp pilus assembly protein TadD